MSSAHGEQRPPPGRQGPRARLRRRGALSDRRRDRGDPHSPGRSYVAAVQWHPEFHRRGEGTLDDRPLLDDFLQAARAARAPMTATLKLINPATARRSTRFAADDAASVARKAAQAREAQPAWAARPARRAQGRHRAAFAPPWSSELETLAATLTREVGKPIAQSRNELNGFLARIDFFLDQVERGDGAADACFDDGGDDRTHRPRAARRRRQHLGLELPVLRRLQRLRAGAAHRQRGALQAVRVRGAHRPAHRRACCTARAFRRRCSRPLIGGGDVGAALLEQPVDGVFFTGSSATGAKHRRRGRPRA